MPRLPAAVAVSRAIIALESADAAQVAEHAQVSEATARKWLTDLVARNRVRLVRSRYGREHYEADSTPVEVPLSSTVTVEHGGPGGRLVLWRENAHTGTDVAISLSHDAEVKLLEVLQARAADRAAITG